MSASATQGGHKKSQTVLKTESCAVHCMWQQMSQESWLNTLTFRGLMHC